MNKKKKIIIIAVVAVIVILAVVLGIYFYNKGNKQEETPTKTVEVLDSIEGYDYKLEDRDTNLYKEKFLELKELLEGSEINKETYATLIAELFAIDLYTIDNKNSKYDVGGLDFIYPEEQEEFKNKVTDTMYKLIEDNSTNSRKQELPNVNNIVVTNIEETQYTKGETILGGYKIHLTLSYEKDLGYDENIVITLTNENEKLYVVSLTTEEI